MFYQNILSHVLMGFTNQLSEYFHDSAGTQVFDNGGPTFMHVQLLSCFGIDITSFCNCTIQYILGYLTP